VRPEQVDPGYAGDDEIQLSRKDDVEAVTLAVLFANDCAGRDLIEVHELRKLGSQRVHSGEDRALAHC